MGRGARAESVTCWPNRLGQMTSRSACESWRPTSARRRRRPRSPQCEPRAGAHAEPALHPRGGSRRACGAHASGVEDRDGPGRWGRGRRTSRQLESASRRAQTCRRLGWRLWVPKRKHSMSTRRRRLDPSDAHSHWVVTVRTAGSVSATPLLVSSKWTRMGVRSPRSASARPPSARESRWLFPPHTHLQD